MSPKANQENPHCANRQRGIALLIVLALLVLLVGTVMVGFTGDLARQNKKQQQTTDALALAKEALIGFAAGVDLAVGASRPGDLPCPDTDNDGVAEGSCGNAPGTTGQAARLGRLPWKTLGLKDLRDGDGERLWYAVSNNFKNNFRTSCTAPGQPGCLNSDARGTVTVRDSDGVIVYDGTNPDPFTPGGAIAVIISPGSVIQRQGSATTQDRSAAGVNDPINYLEVGNGEDNAVFTDGTTDGFINGAVYDANRNVIVNDRVLAITYSDLMPILERRVGKEVFNCLTSYAADPQNNGRYPWAADITASAAGDYSDVTNRRQGRLPDSFNQTILGLNLVGTPLICSVTPLLCMRGSWTSNCSIPVGAGTPTTWWWNNWKEMVFYAVAQNYQPADPLSSVLGVPAPGPCGNCLTVNPPSAAANKKFVVMVASKRLSGVAFGQPRVSAGDKSTAAKYLEGENDWTTGAADTFAQQPATSTFNDYLLFQ
jgi:type II secretory pathway pseudopilin PulG